MLHSSNSQWRGHRRDSHTVDEGWLSRGCNPTLHCTPRLTIHPLMPPSSVCVSYSLTNTGFFRLIAKLIIKRIRNTVDLKTVNTNKKNQPPLFTAATASSCCACTIDFQRQQQQIYHLKIVRIFETMDS